MAIKFGGNSSESDSNIQRAPLHISGTNTESAVPSSNNTSGFTRYVGYNDAESFKNKLIDIYMKTKTDGYCFLKPIPKPSMPEVEIVNPLLNSTDFTDAGFVANTIHKLEGMKKLDLKNIGNNQTAETAATAICEVLKDIKSNSPSASAVKNNLCNFLCWFIRYPVKFRNILYIGEMSKSEIYWFAVLGRMGCTISYVNYTDDSTYLSIDKDSRYSSLVKGNINTPLNIEFGKINTAAYSQASQVSEVITAPSPLMLSYLIINKDSFEREILSSQPDRKNRMLCTDTTVPMYYIAYIGFDDETKYNNMLFSLKEEMNKKNKPFTLITELKKASPDEAKDFYSIMNTRDTTMINLFASKLVINGHTDRTTMLQKAFVKEISNIQSNNPHNICVHLCVWFRKYLSKINFSKDDIPVFIYYGTPDISTITFLNILSQTGFDVILFSPDKSAADLIKSSVLSQTQIIEEANSKSDSVFPERFIKAQLATTAYTAERSLDTILYNDNTMFRNYQFKMSQNQTLKTTYEELNLMWHQEAMYRTGFDSKDNYVVVPNMFAKICGIEKGNLQEYYKSISFKLSPLSVYYNKVPFFKPVMPNDQFRQFIRGNKIDIDALKASKYNKYDYMNDDIQLLLFTKLQEVADSGFINVPPADILPLVITVGFNIPANVLQILQNFDFTKDIPKIVIVASGKKTFNVSECIFLVLFNLIGFDIIIFTPTGYKNLETFVKPEAFQTFTLGDFKYDFAAPSMRIPKEIPREKTSFFERIFKGKK